MKRALRVILWLVGHAITAILAILVILIIMPKAEAPRGSRIDAALVQAPIDRSAIQRPPNITSGEPDTALASDEGAAPGGLRSPPQARGATAPAGARYGADVRRWRGAGRPGVAAAARRTAFRSRERDDARIRRPRDARRPGAAAAACRAAASAGARNGAGVRRRRDAGRPGAAAADRRAAAGSGAGDDGGVRRRRRSGRSDAAVAARSAAARRGAGNHGRVRRRRRAGRSSDSAAARRAAGRRRRRSDRRSSGRARAALRSPRLGDRGPGRGGGRFDFRDRRGECGRGETGEFSVRRRKRAAAEARDRRGAMRRSAPDRRRDRADHRPGQSGLRRAGAGARGDDRVRGADRSRCRGRRGCAARRRGGSPTGSRPTPRRPQGPCSESR